MVVYYLNKIDATQVETQKKHTHSIDCIPSHAVKSTKAFYQFILFSIS